MPPSVPNHLGHSRPVPRMADPPLLVEIFDGFVDGGVERGRVLQSLVGKVMTLKSRQLGSTSLSSGT